MKETASTTIFEKPTLEIGERWTTKALGIESVISPSSDIVAVTAASAVNEHTVDAAVKDWLQSPIRRFSSGVREETSIATDIPPSPSDIVLKMASVSGVNVDDEINTSNMPTTDGTTSASSVYYIRAAL